MSEILLLFYIQNHKFLCIKKEGVYKASFFFLHMSHLRNEKICTFYHSQQVIMYTKKHVLCFYACTSFLISVAAWLTCFDFFGKTCFCNYEQFVEFIWNDLTISNISCWVHHYKAFFWSRIVFRTCILWNRLVLFNIYCEDLRFVYLYLPLLYYLLKFSIQI